MSANRLRSLPPGVGKLRALEHLEVEDNPFTALPDELWTPPKLTWLGIDGDQWQHVPEAVRKRGRPAFGVY